MASTKQDGWWWSLRFSWLIVGWFVVLGSNEKETDYGIVWMDNGGWTRRMTQPRPLSALPFYYLKEEGEELWQLSSSWRSLYTSTDLKDLSPGLKYRDGIFDVVGDGTNQSLRTVRHKILPILGTSIPRSTIPDRRSTLSSSGIIGDFRGSS